MGTFIPTFNNYTSGFSAVYEPFTPKMVMNALLLSGSSGGGQIPSGWSVTGSIPFVNEGNGRKYLQFPRSTTPTNMYSSIAAGVGVSYGSNKGGTNVFVIRVKASKDTTSSVNNILVSSGLIRPAFAMYNKLIGTWSTSITSYAIPASLLVGMNEFVVITQVISTVYGTKMYLNGQLFSTSASFPSSLLDSSASGTLYITQQDTTSQTAYDLMYYANYDTPLSQNQVQRIYNSVAPLLSVGPSAPMYTTTTSFTNLVLPASPIVAFNAYDYTLTNGATWVNGGSWTGTIGQTFIYYVDASGRRYVTFNANATGLTKPITATTLMYTNAGYTFATIIRVNAYDPVADPNNIFSSGIFTFNLSKSVSSTMRYLGGFAQNAGQSAQNGIVASSFSQYKGCFMLVVQRQNSLTSCQTYINNQLVGTVTNTLTSGGNQSLLSTSVSIGLNSSLLTTNALDVMYMGFWDRPISDAEMNNLFTSCFMLLDAPSLPISPI